MSVVSSTDIECFRRLSNPEVIDLGTHAISTRQIAQQMREAMEKAVSAQKKEDSDEEEEDEQRSQPEPKPAAEASSLSNAINALSSASRPAAALPSSLPVKPPLPPTPLKPPLTRISEEKEGDDSSDVEQEAPTASARPSLGPKDAETVRLEKQGFLLELHAMQARGIRLTREFNMADSVNELEFELQKQTSLQNTMGAVQNMKDVLRLGLNGLELANAKLGPFICMEGWAESLTTDMKRFDAPLEKLYKRYWRKASMSPLSELAMIILGSLAMHHFKMKVFGRAPSPPPREEPQHQTKSYTLPAGAASKASSSTFQSPTSVPGRLRRPSSQPSPASGDAVRSKRPVLRSPTSLLGF